MEFVINNSAESESEKSSEETELKSAPVKKINYVPTNRTSEETYELLTRLKGLDINRTNATKGLRNAQVKAFRNPPEEMGTVKPFSPSMVKVESTKKKLLKEYVVFGGILVLAGSLAFNNVFDKSAKKQQDQQEIPVNLPQTVVTKKHSRKVAKVDDSTMTSSDSALQLFKESMVRSGSDTTTSMSAAHSVPTLP